jgi:hypothetical protein
MFHSSLFTFHFFYLTPTLSSRRGRGAAFLNFLTSIFSSLVTRHFFTSPQPSPQGEGVELLFFTSLLQYFRHLSLVTFHFFHLTPMLSSRRGSRTAFLYFLTSIFSSLVTCHFKLITSSLITPSRHLFSATKVINFLSVR